jgi:F0F1-type ATP synthase assembly protein I
MRGAWRAAALALQMGFLIVTLAGVGLGLGLLVDGWLGTKPVFFIVGLLLGLLSSFYALYYLVKVQE